ncbi:MAG: response regulator [Lysobacteraceae bacterium]|nr:MAG: response regulator [Xanthomonadaceae bacterium]
MTLLAPTIALVENDATSSTAFQRLLKAHGYAVEAFRSAEAYLARTGPARVDCLLLDVELDGMSGLELQRRTGHGRGAVPIVFMTGGRDPNIEQCAREQGCSGFLYKPFDGLALAAAIEAALAGTASN